jgi:cyclic-di-AMP phosphodiesterase PgpH
MNINKLIVGIFFVIGVALIILVLPIEKKFNFEFQKGQQWLHDDLYAPFDFSIYKSQSRVDKELDSLKNTTKFFFDYNNEIENKLNSKLETKINGLKKTFTENDLNDFLKRTKLIVKEIYQVGVININQVVIKDNNLKDIILLNNKVAESRNVYEFYTPDNAKQKFIELLEPIINKYGLKNDFSVDELFFEPNIDYNDILTKEMYDNIFASYSHTVGKIDVGELIISNGEYVNNQKYDILISLRKEINQRSISPNSFYLIFAGQIVLVLFSFFALVLLIYYSEPDILKTNSEALFIVLIVVFFVSLSALSAKFYAMNIYVIPFAMIPIIIKAFFNERIALFTHIVAILISAFNAPNSFEFVFLQIIVGVIVLFSLGNSYRRSYLFLAAMVSFISYCIIYFAIAVMHEGEIDGIYWMQFGWFGFSSILLLSTYPLIFVFEKIFGFLSDMTLIELSDTNNPLLRELAEKAPGTFQHVLQVANLAEMAAREVGADPLLTRVGALYHDIGKIARPMYFTENQSNMANPHDKLSPKESAEIIINHVIDGVKISSKYKLPSQIVSFIKGHHGTTMVKYFYEKQKSMSPSEKIDDADYTYPLEKPMFKEVAIMMMADVVEAASRSLKEHDPKSITNLIDKLISAKIAENQFDNVDLSFRDVTRIKQLFAKKIINIYHSRIEYPDKK